MMRAVLDTNVVVSALIWGGKPFTLFRAAAAGDALLFTSLALIDELRGVLARGHLAIRLQSRLSSVERAVALYGSLATVVAPCDTPHVVPGDPDDDHVIAAAVTASADLIVSGDQHLLTLRTHRGIRIVTPAEAAAGLMR